MATLELKFGHKQKSLKEVSRTLTLFLIGPGELPGGFYANQEVWNAIMSAFNGARGDFNDERKAVETVLVQIFKTEDTRSHNFVDMLLCPDCKNAPCPKHEPSNYKMPQIGN